MFLPALPITFCEYTTEKKVYGKHFMSLQFFLCLPVSTRDLVQSNMVYGKIKLFFRVKGISKWNFKALFGAIIALIICPH